VLLPAASLLLILIGAYLARDPVLGAMGSFLVRAEPPEKSDVIVVLAGDWKGNRILKAGELVRAGFAAKALVSGPNHHYGVDEHELAIGFAVKRGYPSSYFEGAPNQCNSTKEEAAFFARLLRGRKVEKAIVVTSDYHTRRAGSIFRKAMPEIRLLVVAAPDTYFTARGWWKSREGQKTAFYEWTKTVMTPFGM
jgi:uncharacterized SAM-binding protein YcdF (DUF218 family)